jgi:hypothetical protein
MLVSSSVPAYHDISTFLGLIDFQSHLDDALALERLALAPHGGAAVTTSRC